VRTLEWSAPPVTSRTQCSEFSIVQWERIQAGLQAARARGRLFGRPKALTPQQVKQLRTLAKDKRNTVMEICETLRISRATYYRYIEK
jgi:DNA invertase Pin-like site-specific DNA recombinase